MMEAKGPASITINSAEIRGEVKGTENVESVRISGQASLLGGLSVSGCGSITTRNSTVSSVFGEGVAVVALNITNGCNILGGVTLTKSTGACSVLGSFVGAGGILVSESGPVAVKNSKVDGSFIVEKGDGTMTFKCDTINQSPGDILVNERNGDVLIDGCAVSDISVGLVDGDVTLEKITTDSDTMI
jgi:hypothetical protein